MGENADYQAHGQDIKIDTVWAFDQGMKSQEIGCRPTDYDDNKIDNSVEENHIVGST